MTETALIPTTINPVEIFTGGKMPGLLAFCESQKKDWPEPDASTPKGRADIKAKCTVITKSKTHIGKSGEDFTRQLKAQVKKDVDATIAARHLAADTFDKMKTDYREPLTKWEAEQQALKDAEEARIIREMEETEAMEMNVAFDEKREMEAKIAALEKAEAERIAKEEAERKEQERQTRDAKLKADAEAKAKREAQEALDRAEEESRRNLEAAAEALRREKQERIEAEEAAERRRLQDIADTERRLAEDAARVERERAAKEKERLDNEAKEKAAAERKSKHKAHRAKVNREVEAAMVENHFEQASFAEMIGMFSAGKIPYITIDYS